MDNLPLGCRCAPVLASHPQGLLHKSTSRDKSRSGVRLMPHPATLLKHPFCPVLTAVSQPDGPRAKAWLLDPRVLSLRPSRARYPHRLLRYYNKQKKPFKDSKPMPGDAPRLCRFRIFRHMRHKPALRRQIVLSGGGLNTQTLMCLAIPSDPCGLDFSRRMAIGSYFPRPSCSSRSALTRDAVECFETLNRRQLNVLLWCLCFPPHR